ncbi:NAD(P)-binding protein [Neorhizobium galegae]|uniref:NAD(P)-binding protein n=1 Tax=Neorhizobium galegae TaxID=399 RepID=UPI00349E8CD5
MSKLKVIIAGAGLGGLCLAQILRRADVEVEIFESDSGPWDRPQGYRLHIDRDAAAAVHHDCRYDTQGIAADTERRARQDAEALAC